MANNIPSVVQVILVRGDGSFILQLRDEKEGLVNSGRVTAFGGSVKPGETLKEAAIREINKETNLVIDPARLNFFKKYRKTKKAYGENSRVYYFIVKNIDDKGLKIYEGQGFVVVDPNIELSFVELSTMMQKVIKDYKKVYLT